MLKTILLAGILAGLIHVLSGPDHLAAIGAIAVKERRPAWRIGLAWGIGHAFGAAVIGLTAFLLRELIPVEWISAWGERLVGIVLLGIGFWGLKRSAHARQGLSHYAAFGVGTLHGVAGVSHFLNMLPALLLPTRLATFSYIAAFSLGTVGAMAGFAWILGFAGSRTSILGETAYRRLLAGCSLASIAVGCFWIVSNF